MSLRASAGYVGGRAAAGALSLVAMGLFARGLGPEGYAWYALAVTTSTFTATVLLQPVVQALGRFLAHDAGVAATLARLVVGLSIILAATALGAEVALHLWWPGLVGLALAALALGVTQGSFDFSAQHASASLLPGRYTRIYLTRAVLLVCAAALVWQLRLGVASSVALVSAVSLLATLGPGRQGWHGMAVAHLDTDMRRRIRMYYVPAALSILVSNALQFTDRFILAAMAPTHELGAYAAVGDLAQQSLGFLVGSLYLAWYPRMVAAYEPDRPEQRRLSGRYAMLACAVMLPATLGFGLLGPALTHVFFGPAYATTAAQVWWPVTMAVALAGVRMYFLDIGLYLTSRMHLQLRNVSVAAVLVLLLDLWWIPMHGAAGAAWAAVAGQCFALLLSAWSSKGVVGWQLPLKQTWPVLPACALMAWLVFALDGQGLAALVQQIAVGGLAYGLCMLILDGAGCRTWLCNAWERTPWSIKRTGRW